MDPPSSSVGFPLSGNPESPENSPPRHFSSVGVSRSENPQPAESLPPQHSSSSPVGIPPLENTQSTEISPNRQFTNNRPTPIIITDAQWNVDLACLYHDNHFCRFMRGGECDSAFIDWYGCMHRAIYHGGHWTDCTEKAGVLRSCIFDHLEYYQPLITYFWNRYRRQ